MLRTDIRIYGKVQGVGLRIMIKNAADDLGVNGTVENMDDGSVLVECEAEEAIIQKFISRIRAFTEPVIITDLQTESHPASGMRNFKMITGNKPEELLIAVRAGITELRKISKSQVNVEHTLENMGNTLENMGNTLKSIESTQENMGNTLKSIESTQKNIENTQESMGNTLKSIESTQKNIENTQESMHYTIKSIDHNISRSLENDSEILGILRHKR